MRDANRDALALACGVGAAIVYVVGDLVATASWDAYSYTSQTVSELSAIDAPTRSMWIAFGTVHALLLLVFGLGVWASAGSRRVLRATAGLLIVIAVLGPFWPPMHLRGQVPTTTDTLHIVFTGITSVCIVAAMACAAIALRGRFRTFSLATIAVLVTAGAWAGQQGPRIPTGEPTPWMGLVERVTLYGYLLWLVVLASSLLRARDLRVHDGAAGSSGVGPSANENGG